MKIKGIYKGNDKVYKVLDSKESLLLVIDCIKKSMPTWVSKAFLDGYEEVGNDELKRITNVVILGEDNLSDEQMADARRKYGSISAIVPLVGEEAKRSAAISLCSKSYHLSKATLRNRLCSYLVYEDISIFVLTKKEKYLSQEQKNFRWALNKYFYNSKQLSLRQAYKELLKQKYCDSNGNLLQNYPKFHQFKYFYYKTRIETNYIISRFGRGEYDRNFRPLIGGTVRDFCPSIGYGMFDSTILDIYLVNESGELIGRPVMTACVDAYTTLCLGYSLGYEGGTNSLNQLVNNIVSNKVDLCRKFGIEIKEEDWNVHSLPHKFITDKGSEYVSETFSQLTDLGIEFINLAPYRPELKSIVERFFGLIQESFKKELIHKGIVLKDVGKRGTIDYRKNACLTIKQFEKIVLLAIIHYNKGRIIDLPNGIDAKPFANQLWNLCFETQSVNLIDVSKEQLDLVLLPRTIGTFKRDGLHVNKLRYRNGDYTESYLKGGKCLVAYNPKNVSKVYLVENNQFIEFEIIEPFYKDLALVDIESLRTKKDVLIKEAQEESIQSEIDLSKQVEAIVSLVAPLHPKVKNLKKNKKKEINRGRGNE